MITKNQRKNIKYGKMSPSSILIAIMLIAGMIVFTVVLVILQSNDKNSVETISKGITDLGYIEEKGVNGPVLKEGMTPIKWDASGNMVKTTTDDPDWYDYNDKKWANAQTQDGSMWVWIPRYEYRIPNAHTGIAKTISVNFLKGTQKAISGGYIVHPAFKFGDTELTGIWVAKFEASGNANEVDIKPNATSLRSLTVNDIFTATRNMESNNRYGWGTDGLGIDTHLMKNIEWGAVAYLSNSSYGKNEEVWINPYWDNGNMKTGQVGTSAIASYTKSTYSYNDSHYGINGSTSGTVYGVYDMSGGAWEYTAAYANNGNESLTAFGESLVNAEDKYKDMYSVTNDGYEQNYKDNAGKKGDAVYETSAGTNGSGLLSCYSDSSYMPYYSEPFFVRGGSYGNTTSAGVFAFFSNIGDVDTTIGFRPVLIVNQGL